MLGRNSGGNPEGEKKRMKEDDGWKSSSCGGKTVGTKEREQ